MMCKYGIHENKNKPFQVCVTPDKQLGDVKFATEFNTSIKACFNTSALTAVTCGNTRSIVETVESISNFDRPILISTKWKGF
jgi:hypothetical protein